MVALNHYVSLGHGLQQNFIDDLVTARHGQPDSTSSFTVFEASSPTAMIYARLLESIKSNRLTSCFNPCKFKTDSNIIRFIFERQQ